MAATILTFALTLIIAGSTWALLGAKFKLADDPERNSLLNLVTYYVGLLPVIFVIVFFLIERL